MSSKYKVVVVGTGKRGMHHAQAFQANGRFEVWACAMSTGPGWTRPRPSLGPPRARTRSRCTGNEARRLLLLYTPESAQ
jgi:hypothetical protein